MRKIFSNSKARLVTAGAVAGALIVLCICAVQGEGLQGSKLILALLLSVFSGFYIIIRPGLRGALGAAIALILPQAAVCCMEFYTHVPWDLTPGIFLLNCLGFLLLDLALSCLFGHTGWGFAVGTGIPMLFGLANYFVVNFRSSPIVPWDFLSLGTASSVAGNYEFTITYRLAFVLLGFAYVIITAEKLRLSMPKKWKGRIAACLLSFGLLWGYVSAVQTETVKEVFGLDDTLFTPNVLYRNNGWAVAFLANLQYLDVEKPEGYSPEKAEEIAAESGWNEEEEETVAEKASEDSPNILVIMNEAFSDLGVYGDFETSEDYMPFIHSLEENTVKGSLYVSVKGGNTANTEFEFLTGNSMAFLPAGSVPYQQFIKGDMPSLASHMKSLGYSTAALHPYYSSGWNREQVYEYFGFDRTYFREDFTNASLLRGWVDDESAFDKLIELYEEKEEGEKLFAFEVTMQNHGGYSKEYADLSAEIRLTGYPEEMRSIQVQAAEKYLTLMKKTDEAFQRLVEYFEHEQEPTLILMFGDHQPSDYITNVIQNLLGQDASEAETSLEELAKRYEVPFIMWANYDLEEEEGEALSANYLSNLLMEKAGLGKSGYQEYLDQLSESYPVITANFCQDESGKLQKIEKLARSENPYSLYGYGVLQYNDLCDPKNRLKGFF